MRGLGPLIYKDFTIAGRRWPTYLWRALAVVILGAIVIWVYVEVLRSRRWLGASALATAGQAMTVAILIVTYVVVSLGMPGAVIRGMMDERERGTLALLVASPLQPWRVAFGKTLAGIGKTVMTALGMAPLVFLILAFGGSEGGAVFDGFLYVASGGLLGVALGLPFLSMRTRGPIVILGAYLALIAFVGVPLIVQFIWWWEGPGGVPLFLGPLLYLNPFQGLLETVASGAFPWASTPWLVEVPILGTFAVDAIAGPWQSLFLSSALVLASGGFFAWSLGRDKGRSALSQKQAPPAGRVNESFPIWWYETRIRIPRQGRRTRWLTTIVFGGVAALTYVICIAAAGDFGDGFAAGTFILTVEWMILLLLNSTVRGAWAGGDPRSEMPLLVAPISMSAVALEKIGSVLSKSLRGVVVMGLLLLITQAVFEEARHHDQRPAEYVTDWALAMMSIGLGVTMLATLGCLMARLTGSATRGTATALSIFIGVAIGLPFFLVLTGVDDDIVEPLCGATNPIFMTAWMLFERGGSDLGAAAGALVLQSALVLGLIGVTTARWQALSVRRT